MRRGAGRGWWRSEGVQCAHKEDGGTSQVCVSALVKNYRRNMSRRSLIGSPARTALKDVNMRVNDDQAEKSARRMSVYPIKGGLGDRAAPATPFKSPFKSGAHLREFTSATPGAAQTLSPSRLGDLYQNCIKLSNENVSLYHNTDYDLRSLMIFFHRHTSCCRKSIKKMPSRCPCWIISIKSFIKMVTKHRIL